MENKNMIESLRGNTSLIISTLGFFVLCFLSIPLFNGVEYDTIPYYLRISNYISILFFTIGLIQSLRINIERGTKFKKIYAKFLVTNNILMLMSIIIVFDNIYYLSAIQNGIDLYNFWLLNIITTVSSFALYTIGCTLLLTKYKILLKFITPKTRTFIGLLFMLASYTIYIVRIIIFIKIPSIADNDFLIIISTFIIVGFYIAILSLVRQYSVFKVKENIKD
ncbi:DUF5079 family protein [Staphylococcus agnetis]|uniref:DUF5079 family protein n=1 Tax=Staphylococcus agnetis TaxID=985762 RepID=UPI0021D1266C|nr:DUF5079 family protein [Staphylococcus agnetis]UXU59461.1 DUF5079 family protein [Staphylococcus agnetis]UXU61789.1 DUF5079 family protein [Staphylococcus agnetis]